MTPYRFYKTYHPIQLHFTVETFDMFKYNGKSNVLDQDQFEKKKEYDKYEYYARTIEDKDVVTFCVFNFLQTHNWLYVQHEESKKRYLDGMKFYSAFSYNINADYAKVKKIKDEKQISFDDLLHDTPSGNKAPLLQMFLQKMVSLEFICLLNRTYKLVELWSDKYYIDPLISAELLRIKKYTPFVEIFRKHGSKYF